MPTARIKQASKSVLTPTVTDPKLQVHVDAINRAYELFNDAMSKGDIETAMQEVDEGSTLRKNFPEAWAIAAKAHGVNPATLSRTGDDSSDDLAELFE